MDFGLSRVAPRESNRNELSYFTTDSLKITQTGALVGTLRYMAKEQILGREPDERADQFIFCVAFYEALCNQAPFAGSSAEDYFKNVVEGQTIIPFGLNKESPRWLWKIVRRGFLADRDQRFSSLSQLLMQIRLKLRKNYLRRFVSVGASVATLMSVFFVYGYVALNKPIRERVGLGVGTVVKQLKSTALPKMSKPLVKNTSSATAQVYGEFNLEPTGEQQSRRLVSASDWCSMHEDHYTLIKKGHRQQTFIKNRKGDCFHCRVERRKQRIRRFQPQDCSFYQVCGPVESVC